MSQGIERLWSSVVGPVCLLASFAGVSVAQNAVPDAQVEANVLRALAGAPELANDAITTQTVYGTVTLTGSVHDEAARRRAETLAANAAGVKKVVDELRLGSASDLPSQSAVAQDGGAASLVLQSDGTYAPADGQITAQGGAQKPLPGSAPAEQAQRNNPDGDQQLDQQMQQQNPSAQAPGAQSTVPQGQAPYGSQTGSVTNSGAPQQAGQQPYPVTPSPYGRRPMYNPNYPGYPSYPQNPGYPSYPQNPGYAQSPQQGPGEGGYAQQTAGGQAAGETVVIPSGAMIRVRTNQPLSSNRSQPGSTFDGIVANDVVAGNVVAIPRGATVQGKVIDAKGSGALKGRGEMQVQLTSVTLGGRVYPLLSDVWDHHGGDKTIETINKTAGFGAGGAVIGALAGGGVGAAVGGGIGAALGLGSSAASGNGQVYIPSEAILTFHTAQDATVTTVSEQEMQRLAYGVPVGASQRQLRPRYPVYVAPGYPYPYNRYPGPYGPYGY